VFVTVKTKGVVALFSSRDSCAIAVLGSRKLTRVERADRVVRDVLPKVETSRIDEIDNNATARIIRSAKARGEAFFFILFWVRFWEPSMQIYHLFLRGSQQQGSRKNLITDFWEERAARVKLRKKDGWHLALATTTLPRVGPFLSL
jgi:hypothetical protein